MSIHPPPSLLIAPVSGAAINRPQPLAQAAGARLRAHTHPRTPAHWATQLHTQGTEPTLAHSMPGMEGCTHSPAALTEPSQGLSQGGRGRCSIPMLVPHGHGAGSRPVALTSSSVGSGLAARPPRGAGTLVYALGYLQWGGVTWGLFPPAWSLAPQRSPLWHGHHSVCLIEHPRGPLQPSWGESHPGGGPDPSAHSRETGLCVDSILALLWALLGQA